MICGSGWLVFNESCYRIKQSREINWNDARRACNELGDHLLKIDDLSEQTIIFNQIKRHYSSVGNILISFVVLVWILLNMENITFIFIQKAVNPLVRILFSTCNLLTYLHWWNNRGVSFHRACNITSQHNIWFNDLIRLGYYLNTNI